jgi:hypothetical protein
MIYILTIAFITALLVGRSPIKCFDRVRFRYPLLLIAPVVVQIILFVGFRINPIQFSYLLEITVLVLILGLWFNREVKGIKWIAVGSSLNVLALLVHNGRMPVLEQALIIARVPNIPDDSRHQLMSASPFWWLGDWIPLYKMVISIGDLLVGVGIFTFIIMNSPPRRKNETD